MQLYDGINQWTKQSIKQLLADFVMLNKSYQYVAFIRNTSKCLKINLAHLLVEFHRNRLKTWDNKLNISQNFVYCTVWIRHDLNTKKVVNTILSTYWIYLENKCDLNSHLQILKFLGAWLRSIAFRFERQSLPDRNILFSFNSLSASITKLNYTNKMKLVLSYSQALSTL